MLHTFDELEKVAERKNIIRVKCIKIPRHLDPPLKQKAVKKFEVSREYNAEYMIDSKLESGWIVEDVPFKQHEIREHFSLVG